MSWNDMEVFCAVAAQLSFSRAAERLELPKSSVSRAVSALEMRMGVRLLDRTTRRLRLTDAGRDLHEQVAPLFERLHDVVEEAQTQRNQPRGVLRISTPFEFGVLQLNSVVCEVLARHAGMEVEIEMSTQRHHPLEGNFDLVFSLHEGDPEDSSMVARRVFTVTTMLCAAPALVDRLGMPRHPRELAEWPCLCDGMDTVWRFTGVQDDELHEIAVHGPLRTHNASLRLGATEAGLGASVISTTLCREAMEHGRLVKLLPDYRPAARRVYAFMPGGRLMPARVRVFLDALSELAPGSEPPLNSVSPLRHR
ncbi:MAG: LysR family transcriptional regulator [Zoogloea sp.]|nr:LysR family transcriptional regulator [Zoogloea sp.]